MLEAGVVSAENPQLWAIVACRPHGVSVVSVALDHGGGELAPFIKAELVKPELVKPKVVTEAAAKGLSSCQI